LFTLIDDETGRSLFYVGASTFGLGRPQVDVGRYFFTKFLFIFRVEVDLMWGGWKLGNLSLNSSAIGSFVSYVNRGKLWLPALFVYAIVAAERLLS